MDEGVGRAGVRIQSQTSEHLWVQVDTDSSGNYAAEVPEGRYQVQVHRPDRDPLPAGSATVRPNETVQVDLVAKSPRGRILENIRVEAPWRIFNRTDGIILTSLTSIIMDIFKDRQGYLWFATLNGLNRYDGQRFTTLTTADGLVHNQTMRIGEDRDGRLWFGTRGGLSRYDGRSFTNFTVEDGLAHNQASSIARDDSGNIRWEILSKTRPVICGSITSAIQ